MNFFQNFGQKLSEFAMNGLGGGFAKGVGTVIAVVFALSPSFNTNVTHNHV